MRFNRLIAWLAVHALVLQPALSPSAAQEAAAPAQTPRELPTFGVAASAVTLDVVVRDKKGNAVRDLQASDFQVFEDDVAQQVDSFEVFGRDSEPPPPRPAAPAPAAAAPAAGAPAAPATPAAAPAPAAAAPAGEVRPQVIAFVFDRLSSFARANAHKAALTYLDRGHVEGDLVGVFAIDLALRTIQPFTTDRELVRAGLNGAASQGNTAFSSGRERMRELTDIVSAGERATEAASGAAPSGPGASTAGQSIAASAGAGALNQALARMQVGMMRALDTLERDQQGYASTNGLLAVVTGLKNLPGRKTVVFFSEGLAIPTNVQAQFRSVIHNANRSNVSVYAMDAAGLRATSQYEETRNELNQAGERRLQQVATGADTVGGAMSKDLERNEDRLRLAPNSGLAQLANETGGFLIQDTNDAASSFRRIEEDMRFHYLLGYSPSNENYDGKFRAISVKVKRPGLQVQTRQGYFALRVPESAPLRSFEAPALALLDRQPPPKALPLEAVALSFPSGSRPGLAPVLVRIPGNTVTYEPERQDRSGKKMHQADFTVVARVVDAAGKEVDRLSQHYLLRAPQDNLAAARGGDVLFYREADLPPGKYKVDVVAYDALVQKAGVTSAFLEIPPAAEGRPRLSSVVLVGRAEKAAPADATADNPLFYGETILYPNMGAPFRKSATPNLGFFFTVYGVPAGTAPKATIEVFRGEQGAGRVTADLPAPDAKGRIQYAGALPLQGFAPGNYTFKVTTTAGGGTDSRQAPFVVAE
jgi:VWFA-related protein